MLSKRRSEKMTTNAPVKGEKFTATVEVVKVKNGNPTVIVVNGQTYTLVHGSQFR